MCTGFIVHVFVISYIYCSNCLIFHFFLDVYGFSLPLRSFSIGSTLQLNFLCFGYFFFVNVFFFVIELTIKFAAGEEGTITDDNGR